MISSWAGSAVGAWTWIFGLVPGERLLRPILQRYLLLVMVPTTTINTERVGEGHRDAWMDERIKKESCETVK